MSSYKSFTEHMWKTADVNVHHRALSQPRSHRSPSICRLHALRHLKHLACCDITIFPSLHLHGSASSGDHLATYTNTESLCCTPEINIMLHVNYSIIKICIKKESQLKLSNKVEALFLNRFFYVTAVLVSCVLMWLLIQIVSDTVFVAVIQQWTRQTKSVLRGHIFG